DDLQALGDRVAEQGRDGKIGLQRRAHGLHVAHLAHSLPAATRFPQCRYRDRSEYTRVCPDRYRQRVACVRSASAGSGPNKSVAAQGLAILATAKLCCEGEVDSAGLEFLQQNDRVLADERNPYARKRLTEAPQDRWRVATDDVIGDAELDLAFKRGL